jgi:hypothetical protein
MSAPPNSPLTDLVRVLARAAVDRKVRGIGAPPFCFYGVLRGKRVYIEIRRTP